MAVDYSQLVDVKLSDEDINTVCRVMASIPDPEDFVVSIDIMIKGMREKSENFAYNVAKLTEALEAKKKERKNATTT